MNTSIPDLPVRNEELESAIQHAHDEGRLDAVLMIAEDQQRALQHWQSRIEGLVDVVENLKAEARRLKEENERLRSQNEAYSPMM